MSMDASWLVDVLAADAVVHLVDAPGADAVAARLPSSVRLTREPAPQGAWVWLHQHLDEVHGIDFLAGRGRGRDWGEALRPWAWPAALAASIFVAQLGLMLMQTHQLRQQTQAMQAELEDVARKAAPEVRRWVNPLVQLRQMAKGSGIAEAEGGFLPMLALMSPALQSQPAVKLGALRYQASARAQEGKTPASAGRSSGRPSGGVLEAQLEAPGAEMLEALKNGLKLPAGVQGELGGLRAEGGRAEARLRIKEGGA